MSAVQPFVCRVASKRNERESQRHGSVFNWSGMVFGGGGGSEVRWLAEGGETRTVLRFRENGETLLIKGIATRPAPVNNLAILCSICLSARPRQIEYAAQDSQIP